MGYYLQSFISNEEDLNIFSNRFSYSSMLKLKQNITLILLDEDLFQQINNDTKSNVIKGFEYLTTNLETQINLNFSDRTIGYIEAEYWGGEGSQSAIIWNNGKRILEVIDSSDAINSVLRFFEVVKEKELDEFDTLEFGLLKSDRSWYSY